MGTAEDQLRVLSSCPVPEGMHMRREEAGQVAGRVAKTLGEVPGLGPQCLSLTEVPLGQVQSQGIHFLCCVFLQCS